MSSVMVVVPGPAVRGCSAFFAGVGTGHVAERVICDLRHTGPVRIGASLFPARRSRGRVTLRGEHGDNLRVRDLPAGLIHERDPDRPIAAGLMPADEGLLGPRQMLVPRC